MDIIIIKNAAVTILGNEAAGRFNVIGYEKQTKSADAINKNKLVQVFWESGEFPRQGGNIGPIDHNFTIKIRLTVAAEAKGDLTTINDSGSTPAQRTAAITNLLNAAQQADSEIDELISVVWNILMDARNKYLGLEKGFISSRWIPSIKKDETVEDGEYAVKTAEIIYQGETGEEVQGDPGVTPETVVMDNIIKTGDTEIGIEVDNPST